MRDWKDGTGSVHDGMLMKRHPSAIHLSESDSRSPLRATLAYTRE
jgi:hypothetical protein